jgi:hypothetical protein
MKQSDAPQSGKNNRERGGYSYKVKNGSPDLKEQIRELGALEDSLYFGRSEADIAGMVLLKFVPKEIEKHKHREGK